MANQIPNVPLRTPMFEQLGGAPDRPLTPKDLTALKLDRTWIIFFERNFGGSGSGSAGPFQRTLLLKDTTVGNDIADHVTVYGATVGQASTAQRVLAVLRKAITSDLTVRIKLYSSAGVLIGTVGTFTIPRTTPINTPVVSTTFTTAGFPDKSVLTWDVTASDGSIDGAGIASYTLEWQ